MRRDLTESFHPIRDRDTSQLANHKTGASQSMISWQKLQVWQMSILSQVERFLWLVSFPFLNSLLRFQTRKGTWYFCVSYELKVNISAGLCHCWLLSLYLDSTILGCYLSTLWVLRNLNLNIPVIVRQTLNPVSSLYLERSHRYQMITYNLWTLSFSIEPLWSSSMFYIAGRRFLKTIWSCLK